MIYELGAYALAPGTAEYIKRWGDVGRKGRGDRYGKLDPSPYSRMR